MHLADRSLKFVAGSDGLKAFRFCMPSQGISDPTRTGLWFNSGFGRQMVPLAITDRDVEPGAKFRAIMPHQEVLAEMRNTADPGVPGEWVILSSDGTIAPVDNGHSDGSMFAGILLEPSQPGQVVRILFAPFGDANFGDEQVLEP